jgi:superfamily II DNA or RNA helicase
MLTFQAMDLPSALAPMVASEVRRRGEAYLREGRVWIIDHGKRLVTAMVSGSGASAYHVELERMQESLVVSCTCPYYQRDFEACKHIWASVLAAGAKGYLGGAAGNVPHRIEPSEAEPWDLDVDDSDSDFELERQLERELAGRPRPAGGHQRSGARSMPWETLPASRFPPPSKPPAGWRDYMTRLAAEPLPSPPPVEELHYVLDLRATAQSGAVLLELLERSRKANGEWGKLRNLKLDRDDVTSRLPTAIDRQILALLAGARRHLGGAPGWQTWRSYDPVPVHNELPEPLLPLLLPLLCASGRARLRREARDPEGPPLVWDDGEPWTLWLEVRRAEEAGGYVVAGSLRRGEERLPLELPLLLLRAGFFFTADRVARLDHGGAFGWIAVLRQERRLHVPAADAEELTARLFALATGPPVDLPEELRCKEVAEAPVSRLLLLASDGRSSPWQEAAPSFRYSAGEVAAGAPGRRLHHPASRTLVLRDREAEARARQRLQEMGFRAAAGGAGGRNGDRLQVQRRQVAEVVRALLGEGWLVEAEGRRLRAPSRFHLAVSSQVDWFELRGEVEFDGEVVPMPALLAALKRGEDAIRLGDGSSGLLPEEWLRRVAPLAAFGQPAGDHLRFRATQVGLLDALLAAEPTGTCDAAFAQARQRLLRFAGIEAAEAPSGFRGELRAYQKAGLGWLDFLREFGFGGCLADDMGLGKTVQVLALLESRRTLRQRQRLGPALAVVPRSLIFNWIAEAARFTPGLRVRNHTGVERDRRGDAFADCDLVLTTYGTLRRDVACLRQTEFDYIVLDEAQAIKNPHSESAKAARLLKGSHRLALTGTPVENHLGDLWSLLEFLNPGITGASPVLRSAGAGPRDPDEATRVQLSRALRPFILRRTKEQVAAELPSKSEQTILCELPARQRRLYDDLRDHYRAALGARVQEQGLGRVKILVLEALLRLRQAACHAGLLDPGRDQEPSAKLEFLLPQLAEVLEQGHKALVFSQFTSFLAILRRHLDREGIAHAYLDGRTRDRAERVTRFQTDPACKLFLISLKAGGLGLNLTAADYVYLLDPWWNPAVEAQAIDRAHRIGQSRRVFAYRIVAKDTVEEKILALQQSKRQLADAIVAADDSLLRRLSREDLELLLS